jgi:ABC-type transporter Mla MlaB component
MLKVHAVIASPDATGALVGGEATALAASVDEHLVAGRLFVRLDLSGITSADQAAVGILTRMHDRLLAEGGTLVLTGVDPRLEAALAPGEDAFLMIAPTAGHELADRRAGLPAIPATSPT